jgi:hypothetical protein
MSNPLYGQNKFDGSLNNADYIKNKMAFMAGEYGELQLQAAADTTDAKTDTGYTLLVNHISESLWDGDGAAAAMVLPAATKGALTVFRFAAQADGGQSITFTTASGESFHPGVLCIPVTNMGDTLTGLRKPAIVQEFVQSVATSGGALKTVTAGNNTLVIAATATNNQTATGADLAFFCEEAGLWKIGFIGSELGSGAINATFATSTV